MHPDGAKQDRQQRQRHSTRGNAEDQGQTAEHFSKDGQVGEEPVQAEALEIADGSGDREDEYLEQSVGHEQTAGEHA